MNFHKNYDTLIFMSSKSLSIKTANDPVHNPEIIKVPKNTEQVSCDGGNPALGHPVVYYRFDGADYVDCGYCDRRFIKAK
jgi:uncharacterized Zn-finger protein